MLRVKIEFTELKLFAGIAEIEKKRKNRIVLILEYEEVRGKIVDYSKVYDTAERKILSKKWNYLEDMAFETHREIIKEHKNIKSLHVRVRKVNPPSMKNCRYSEVFYDGR
ncbi:MAG: dihydroneopterin aldolase [bacterium]|nr:dihydroneopterin aldolase [bacterium]